MSHWRIKFASVGSHMGDTQEQISKYVHFTPPYPIGQQVLFVNIILFFLFQVAPIPDSGV